MCPPLWTLVQLQLQDKVSAGEQQGRREPHGRAASKSHGNKLAK